MRQAHTYTPQTLDAAKVLGIEIARARRKRRWTTAELASRAGISTGTLLRVERGDPTVSIGIVFEAATLLGIQLFGANRNELAALVARGQERLALLPARIREPDGPVDDDF
jgi:transcriptional regulator with XRE-family HTH domain